MSQRSKEFPGHRHVREYPDEPQHKFYSKANIDEGICRYKLAQLLAKDLTILDVACGSGYGPEILEEVANKVIAIDMDSEAIEYCKWHYPESGVEYQVMDGRQLKFEDGTFDYLVNHGSLCFNEPPEQHQILSEFVRVLKPDGIAMISVNYNAYYGPDKTGAHPYHIWAYDSVGLHNILIEHFRNFHIFVQHQCHFHADPMDPGTTWIVLLSNDENRFRWADGQLMPYWLGGKEIKSDWKCKKPTR